MKQVFLVTLDEQANRDTVVAAEIVTAITEYLKTHVPEKFRHTAITVERV